jgi:hypothetical protein
MWINFDYFVSIVVTPVILLKPLGARRFIYFSRLICLYYLILEKRCKRLYKRASTDVHFYHMTNIDYELSQRESAFQYLIL